MSKDIDKVSWKQNGMHPSEVFIDVEFRSEKSVKFLLQEDMVNHLFQRRLEKIEMHFNLKGKDPAEVHVVDFSKIKPVKPVYPLLQQNVKLPKIEKAPSENGLEGNGKIGVYSISHTDSNQWLTNKGWLPDQTCFDIVPEKVIESNLKVSIAPQKAVDSGAGWRVNDMPWKESNATVSIERGNCVVEFKSLVDWEAPKDRQVYILEGIDENISAEYQRDRPKLLRRKPINVLSLCLIIFACFFGVYWLVRSPPRGTLVAVLSPSEVVAQGAQWRIEDGEWQASAGTIELNAGEYEVEFKSLNGWHPPAEQHVSLKEGQTTQIDVAYDRELAIQITPEEAVQSGAQWKIKGAAAWHDSNESLTLSQGHGHKLIFKNIDGWNAPAEKVISNSESAITAEYRKKPSTTEIFEKSVMVKINPSEAVRAGALWKLEGPGEWKASEEKVSGLINIPYTIIFKSIDGWKKPHSIKLAGQNAAAIVKEGIYQKVLIHAQAGGEKK